MPKIMNKSMQMWNIGRMIADHSRHATDTIDLKALVDPRLTLNENKQNIARQIGMSQRNKGLEQHEQAQHERARAKAQRADPLRQVGWSFNRKEDEARSALPPGKRVSKNGKRYYERRTNRSDRPPGRV